VTSLFALFPFRWEANPAAAGSEQKLGWRWTALLSKYPELEKALFSANLLQEEPGAYPATWRRFIRVGTSLPEEVANLFELCHEKGYEQVIFADTICAALSEERLDAFLQAAARCDIALMPAGDGSVLMMSMPMHLFPEWEFFRFHASGSVVEILSECHTRNLSYELSDGLNLMETEKVLAALLEKTKKPEIP
jgi:hypothetical protein